MRRCGLVMHPIFLEHDPGPGHPECPRRLEVIERVLEGKKLIEKTRRVEPRPATKEEIVRVHSPEYFERVMSTRGRATALDPDTHTSEKSVEAALLAAGGLLELCRRVMAGELDNGFALVRPPGHHAERARAMGFCLFNNVALAAEHARAALGAQRVLVVDFDLHHGNGTMHSFWRRPDVLYFSTHQYPFYPGTGAVADIGEGEGEGYTVSVPLHRPMGDREFRAIFRSLLTPVAEQFKPDLLLVSAGFDIYQGDPLGSMQVTEEGFGDLAADLLLLADRVCAGRLVLTLEGGYHVEGEAEGVAQVVRALLGERPARPAPDDAGAADAVIRAVQRALEKHWRFR
ncbi:MAG: histone deacetylase [Myxococcales bacterium]|nr:histone deacetylase [Myxococcales bacterium]